MIVDQTNIAKMKMQSQGIDPIGESKGQAASSGVYQKNSYIGQAYNVNSTSVESPVIGNFGSFEDIMEAAQEEEIRKKNESMSALSNTMTKEDYRNMEKEYGEQGNTDVEAITTVVDKMKIEMAKSSDYENFGEDLKQSDIENATSDSGLARRLARKMSYMEKEEPTEEDFQKNEEIMQLMIQKLQMADLPVTKENMEDAMKAFLQAEQLEVPSGGAQRYLLENEKILSIENLYYAVFSGVSENKNSVLEFEQMQNQVEKILNEAGIKVNEKTMGMAEWCIANDIPLTVENIQKKQEMENMQLPLDMEKIVDAMVSAIANGKRPMEASMVGEPSLYEQSAQMMEAVESISDEKLWNLVNQKENLTAGDLIEAAGTKETGESEGNVDLLYLSEISEQKTLSQEQMKALSGTEQRFVTAKRQLEEIRLIMTVEANVALLKKGISLETQSLSQLVDTLKSVEENYYRQLAREQGKLTEEEIFSVREVEKTLGDISNMPSQTLGSSTLWGIEANAAEIPEDAEWSLENLHAEGQKYKEQFHRAQNSYETMGTAPRKDMGDSIQKAFQNVADILEDLGLQDTASNERAVRILGYNSMEISIENIEKIKAADAMVSNLIKNLSPSATLQMIREGFHPMEKSITEVNEKLNEIHQKSAVSDSERFSKYLYQLEQNHEITPEERKSYIGIYRLLNQIEKTDGAVIGALMNQSADITMKNLLSCIRSSRQTGKEYRIDDDFGALESVISTSESISDQINTAFTESTPDSSNGASAEREKQNKTQVEYQAQLVSRILSEISPEKLNRILKENDISEMSLEQFAELLEQQEDLDYSYEKMKLDEIKMVQNSDDYVMRMLSEFELPYSVNNLLAANHLLYHRNEVFQNLFQETEVSKEEIKEMKQKVLDRFLDALETPEELGAVQEELGEKAEHIMETMEVSQNVTSADLRTMHMTYYQIQLSTQMSKEETYHVPVMIGDQMTNVCLKIVNGSKEKGKVAITFETDRLGKVAAELKVHDNKTEGMIAVSEEEGLAVLKEQKEILENALADVTSGETQLRFVSVGDLDLNRYEAGMDREHKKEASESHTSSRQLYQMAKRVIDVLRMGAGGTVNLDS